jgi:hypothetical protein
MLTVSRVCGLIGFLGFVARGGFYDNRDPYAGYLSDFSVSTGTWLG